jgi:hypothetical protein
MEIGYLHQRCFLFADESGGHLWRLVVANDEWSLWAAGVPVVCVCVGDYDREFVGCSDG